MLIHHIANSDSSEHFIVPDGHDVPLGGGGHLVKSATQISFVFGHNDVPEGHWNVVPVPPSAGLH